MTASLSGVIIQICAEIERIEVFCRVLGRQTCSAAARSQDATVYGRRSRPLTQDAQDFTEAVVPVCLGAATLAPLPTHLRMLLGSQVGPAGARGQ